MRVLVTVSPRLYREAVASSLQNIRPGIEVRAVPPEDTDLELAGFKPRLLVHNDTAPVPEGTLSGVRSRVEFHRGFIHLCSHVGAKSGPRADGREVDAGLRYAKAARV